MNSAASSGQLNLVVFLYDEGLLCAVVNECSGGLLVDQLCCRAATLHFPPTPTPLLVSLPLPPCLGPCWSRWTTGRASWLSSI